MTCTEIFERDCPYYLSIGMTYEQYWYGDTMMVRAFREAHKLKKKEENQNLWLLGHYVYDAILATAPIMHAFAKKNAKPIPYLEKPYDIFGDEGKAKSEQEQKQFAENERLRAILFFQNWARAVSKDQENKGSK